MKESLAALELKALETELSGLIGARFDQIYELGPADYLLQLFVSGQGKTKVRIRPPLALYLTSEKDVPEGTPSGFLATLRRAFEGLRLLSLAQIGFDRVVKVSFGRSQPLCHLYLEFFSKGNMVLTDPEGVVQAALIERSYGVRSTKRGETYQLPRAPFDPFKSEESAFLGILEASAGQDLVKSLALDCGLGGIYAEEVLARAGLQTMIKKDALSVDDKKRLWPAVQAILARREPVLVRKDFIVQDALIMPVFRYQGSIIEPQPSFSVAQEQYWRQAPKIQKANPRRQKLLTMIEDQQRSLAAASQLAQEAKAVGDALYARYAEIDPLIGQVRSFAKQHGWIKAKERFSGKGLIKDIDDKTATVILNIQ